MDCQEAQSWMISHIMGDIDTKSYQKHALEEHLRTCSVCSEEYQEFKETIGFIEINKAEFAAAIESCERKEALKKEQNKEVCISIDSKLDENDIEHKRTNIFKLLLRPALAAAACFGILISISFVLLNKNNNVNSTPAQISFNSPSIKIETIVNGIAHVISANQEISTGSGQLATLVINSKHRMILNENTSVSICPLASESNIGCVVNLTSGRIYTHVEHDGNPFVIETNNGQAIITGTTFDIEANKSNMKLIVTEGSVNFKSPQGSVNVSSGHFSEISSKSMPTQPGLCDAKHLTAWATGYELKSALEKIESITDSVDISDLWLTANSGPIDLDEIHYETWIEQKRDWFEKEFPSIFKLQDILLLEGTLAPYQELLFTSGIVWDFKYSHVTNRQFSFITPDSLMRIASSYDVDKNLLLKNMPSIKEQKDMFDGGEAYQKLIGQFELAQKSKESLDSDLLLYSLLASTYLANTRTLIWLYIANESTELTSKDKAELLSLLQSEVNETGKIKEYMIRLFTISKNCSCEEFSVLIDKVIDSLVEIKEIEEKITELKTR